MTPRNAGSRGKGEGRLPSTPRGAPPDETARPAAPPAVPREIPEHPNGGAIAAVSLVPRPKSTMKILRGIAVSPGVAIGPPLVLNPRGLKLPARPIHADAVPAEMERLSRGLERTRADAEATEADARARLGPQYADILAAHARMIADPTLRRDAHARIEKERISAEHAINDVLEGYAARLDSLADAHLAARAADVRDIQGRILASLAGGAKPDSALDAPEAEPSVVLAHDLSPSQTAELDRTRVLGFATEAGGRTSHTAIVAAALEIPAVVGLGRFLDVARSCRMVIIDGDEGLVVLDPDAPTLKRYRRHATERAARFEALATLATLPATTRDGTTIALCGNIEFPAEVAACRERGADGVGLYRTEFLYLNADRPPTEDEQYASYEAVVRSMGSKPVTIRTLDLGADKLVSHGVDGAASRDSPLGLRSIRLSLREPALFRTQLRAILRVTMLGNVRIMFPLISTLGEFRRARAILEDVAAELVAEGVPIRADLPVGAMIEVPAAAVMADQLAKEVDFFSIGTNDLIQYALAVDRTDEAVAGLYNAADPAVLRLIRMVVEAASRPGAEVTVCGSMGGDPLYTMLLIGLGMRALSMPPHQLPEIKQVVRAISLEQARAVATDALRQDTAEAVAALLRTSLRRVLPDVPLSRSGVPEG